MDIFIHIHMHMHDREAAIQNPNQQSATFNESHPSTISIVNSHQHMINNLHSDVNTTESMQVDEVGFCPIWRHEVTL